MRVQGIACGTQALEWDDSALFGLVHGGHKWRLSSTGKKRLFGLMGQSQTQVTLDHEVTGEALSSCDILIKETCM